MKKTWKNKYYILLLQENESIMKRRFLSWLRFIKKQGSLAFLAEKSGAKET